MEVLEDSLKGLDAYVLEDPSCEIRGRSEDPSSVGNFGPTHLIHVGAERQQDVDDDDRIRTEIRLFKIVKLKVVLNRRVDSLKLIIIDFKMS